MATYNDYPKSASNNAKRALKYKADNPDNDCGTRVGWERANQLASRESISRDTIARMASFKRHQQHKDVPYSEGCGGLMWDAWGGTSGIEWAIRKLEEIDSQQSSKMAQIYAFAANNDQLKQVDRETGRMEGVSLISVGEAKGHETFVDEDSLDTALDYLQDAERLPAYITHRGAIFDDRLTREIGIFDNFRIEGEQLKADFQAFDSFREDESRKFNRLFELAEKMPERFGLSIVFAGTKAWATDDGDMPFDPMEDIPDEANFAFPSIRVQEVSSADFVDSPAANERGLFSKIDIKPISKMTKLELSEKNDALEAEKIELSKRVDELTAKVEAFDALSAEKDELDADLTAKEELLSEKEEALAVAEDEQKKLVDELAEKTEAHDELTEKLSTAEAEVERLKKLIDGEEFRERNTSEDDEDYVPSREQRQKRIDEYAAEHGIEKYQAVIELSRKEPKLFKIS